VPSLPGEKVWDPIEKLNKAKKGWGWGLSGRVPALQGQGWVESPVSSKTTQKKQQKKNFKKWDPIKVAKNI
jgi:hypothetical protein